VIVLGFKGLKIEEHAREILAMLGGLGKDLRTFQEDFQLVGKHLTNALNKFEESRRHLDKFTFKLEQIEDKPSLTPEEKKIESKEGS
jgi:DNA anti-recombination protein RmuC